MLLKVRDAKQSQEVLAPFDIAANSPLKVSTYVYALVRLVDKVSVDTAASSCICPRNIWIRCTRQSVRSLAAEGICQRT